jgi:hypothetical protein
MASSSCLAQTCPCRGHHLGPLKHPKRGGGGGGGLPEVIRPFRPEWVTEAATEEALTERLRAVLSGQIPYPPALECQEYVKQNFDWSVILPKIVQVYTLAANDHGSAAQPTTGEQT